MLRSSLTHALIVVVCAAMAGACGPSLPKTPAYPHEDPDFEQVKVEPPPGMEHDEPPALRLRPGDTVSVRIDSTETTTAEGIVVSPTGHIHLPLIGDVEVGGMTLPEAENHIQAKLRKMDRLATAYLSVTELNGHRVTVVGAVRNAGALPMEPGMRVADAMAAAGGPILPSPGRRGGGGNQQGLPADLKAAQVHRDGEPLPISVEKALDGQPRHNVYVYPGDHIYVPPALGEFISVLGAVGNGGIAFPHYPKLRLTEALALAGGLQVNAEESDIRVVRGSLASPKVYRTDFMDIVDGDSHDVALQPGDVVFVDREWLADFGRVLGYITPLISLGFTAGLFSLTLQDATEP